MTDTIDKALITTFSANVHIEAQQMSSKLRSKIKEIPVSGNEHAYDSLGKVEAIEIVTRNAATITQDISHDRRRIKMRDFATTLMLDRFDELQVLIDPAREYAKAVATSMMRKYDILALEAAVASVYTGRNFGTTVTAASDGVTTIANGGTNLTYEKLLSIHETFINNDIGIEESAQIYMAITGKQHTALMKEQELTSGDFSSDYVIDKGRIVKAAGINLILFEGTTTNYLAKSGNIRTCIAFANDGICMGVNQDITLSIDKRPDLNNAQQVQARFFLGGVRTEGERVIKVDCDETA